MCGCAIAGVSFDFDFLGAGLLFFAFFFDFAGLRGRIAAFNFECAGRRLARPAFHFDHCSWTGGLMVCDMVSFLLDFLPLADVLLRSRHFKASR